MWVGNLQVTKVSGSDHRGELRIGGRGQVKLQYTMGRWTCLQVCKTVKGIYTTRGQSIGLASVSDLVAPVGMQI